jgi:hypothetical protein
VTQARFHPDTFRVQERTVTAELTYSTRIGIALVAISVVVLVVSVAVVIAAITVAVVSIPAVLVVLAELVVEVVVMHQQ